MSRWIAAVAVLALVGFVGLAGADDKGAKANPTGTWKWSMPARGDKPGREVTLKLKLDGGKLTGAMVGRNDQETPIEDASFKNGEVKFSITREFQGNKMTAKYSGKVEGDTIKGKVEAGGREGKTNTRDWEAKRAK